jgi:hypothetical protein
VRNRVAESCVTADLRIVIGVTSRIGAPLLSWGFSIVRLSWQRGVCWAPGLVLCLNTGYCSRSLNVVLGPGSADRINEAVFDGGNSTEASERLVLHDRAVDTPALSPECSQPFPQSVRNLSGILQRAESTAIRPRRTTESKTWIPCAPCVSRVLTLW